VYRPATASPEITCDNCKIPLSTSSSSYLELRQDQACGRTYIVDIVFYLTLTNVLKIIFVTFLRFSVYIFERFFTSMLWWSNWLLLSAAKTEILWFMSVVGLAVSTNWRQLTLSLRAPRPAPEATFVSWSTASSYRLSVSAVITTVFDDPYLRNRAR